MKSNLLLITALILAACGGTQNAGTEESVELSGTIIMDGSSTVYPISEAVAEEFRMINPDVKVTIGSSGSGAGFKKFGRGESDIANASRAIKDEEKTACTENSIEFLELRIALDGIAIVVNKENTWMSTITTEELKKLWEPNSTIKKWSDLRPEWPAEEIHLYGPNTAHGTYDFFTEEIVGEAGASRPDYNAVSDYNVAVQGISTDKNALGYFGLSYYNENKDKLKLIGVDSGTGAILPSLETVGNGTYSPLARPLFIYVNKKALDRAEVLAFVKFYIENAAVLSEEVGYIALTQAEYDEAMSQLDAFGKK